MRHLYALGAKEQVRHRSWVHVPAARKGKGHQEQVNTYRGMLHQTVTDIGFTIPLNLENPEVIVTGAIKYGRDQIISVDIPFYLQDCPILTICVLILHIGLQALS